MRDTWIEQIIAKEPEVNHSCVEQQRNTLYWQVAEAIAVGNNYITLCYAISFIGNTVAYAVFIDDDCIGVQWLSDELVITFEYKNKVILAIDEQLFFREVGYGNRISKEVYYYLFENAYNGNNIFDWTIPCPSCGKEVNIKEPGSVRPEKTMFHCGGSDRCIP